MIFYVFSDNSQPKKVTDLTSYSHESSRTGCHWRYGSSQGYNCTSG